MSRRIYTPLRKAEIISLASTMREKYGRKSIDEIAESENIILIREPDASSKKAGYACVLTSAKSKRIASLSRPGEFVFSFVEKDTTLYDCIVINPQYGIPEQEIFWHEFYHLWYSPSRKGKLDFYHQYSTNGALDAQEERRANTFAAFFLIPEVEYGDTSKILSEKWNVSEDLAKLRLKNI
jgi:Zn-dependent peptidase ImmA (M78 family)